MVDQDHHRKTGIADYGKDVGKVDDARRWKCWEK